MSAKKKKHVTPWIQCDDCFAIFSDKVVAKHLESCPHMTEKQDYPFILNNALRTTVERLSSTDPLLNRIPEEARKNLCFLSQPVLQLCGIPFGHPVLITDTEDNKFIRTAWKAHEKQILSAAVTDTDPIGAGLSDSSVSVTMFDKEVLVAKEVFVKIVSPVSNQGKNQLILDNLSNSFVDQILLKNDIIETSLYGRNYQVQIIAISSIVDGGDAEFYCIERDTQWKYIICDESPDENITKKVIGGLESILLDLEQIIQLSLSKSVLTDLFKSRGILLYGPGGTGKSLVMETIAKRMTNSVISITAHKLVEDCEVLLEKLYLQAVREAPSIITIDDLQVIFYKNSSKRDQSRKAVSCLSSMFDRLHRTNEPIVILATSKDPNLIEKSLRRPGRFDKEIELPVPSPADREQILKVILSNVPYCLTEYDLKHVASSTHGFVGADLLALCSTAVADMLRCKTQQLTSYHLFTALPLIKPSAMKEVLVQVPNVRWEDIGGQYDLKHQLRQAVEWPLKYSESFKRLGVTPPRGVLMFGPPGCSKTMIAKALATETGLNFISIKGPELFSKYVGDSEKAVREVFKRARQVAPSIVFFDELDALAGERSASPGGSQVQERVLAQLLTEIDGVESLGAVTIVGATNRPDRVDPALLRPGRLDRVIYVPLPDHDTRTDIFNIQFRNTPVASDVDPNELARLTEGYSGAEVVAVCYEAALKALDKDREATVVTLANFTSALETVKPRTPASSIRLCEFSRNVL